MKILPQPDYLEFALPDRHVCLLGDDGSPLTEKLAGSLIEKGWKVVVLSFPHPFKSSILPSEIDRIFLKELDEDCLKQTLKEAIDTRGAIASFIHLHPFFPSPEPGKICFSEADRVLVKQVFFLAKHLKSSLLSASERGSSHFMTVARLDGGFGWEGKIDFSPIGAGLFGLTKSLNAEWKAVRCRALDLSPHIDPDVSARYIIAELHDPDCRLSEVGYGSTGRTTLAYS